jgi:hypothetical protein
MQSSPNLSRHRPVSELTILALMSFVAATLVVMSALHLTGTIDATGSSNGRSGAGVAEAVIAATLVLGAIGFARRPQRGRTGAQGAVGFAIVGFVFGLTITIPSGSGVDIAYHLTVLPLLVLTLVLLLGAQPDPTLRTR